MAIKENRIAKKIHAVMIVNEKLVKKRLHARSPSQCCFQNWAHTKRVATSNDITVKNG